MSPDKKGRRRRVGKQAESDAPIVRVRPSSDDVHTIVYFQRSDGSEAIPGRVFLKGLPPKVRATMRACLHAVAAAPPKRFAGGGYWEAVHGDMTGWFEVRVNGPQRSHHRLFCRLDYDAEGEDQPLLVVITGFSKAFRTTLSDADYAGVRELRQEHLFKNPRSVS